MFDPDSMMAAATRYWRARRALYLDPRDTAAISVIVETAFNGPAAVRELAKKTLADKYACQVLAGA